MVILGILWIFFLSLPANVLAPGDWELVSEKENMLVYTRSISKGNLKEVRIDGKVNAPLRSVVAALEDIEQHQLWVYKLESSVYVQKKGANHFKYRVLINMPFPIKDREALLQYRRFRDVESDAVIINTKGISDVWVSDSNAVRITDYESTYTLHEGDDRWTYFTYVLHVDPAGKLPNWAINLASVTGPVKTMESFYSLMASGSYADAEIDLTR